LLPAVSGCGRLWFESFLEKLDQSINQPAAAANDVQTAFVLVFFENLIKAAFQLLHMLTPSAGFLRVQRFRLP
jgi:hypothetical protein